MSLRPFQQKFNDIIIDVKNGASVNEIFVFAVPGSGKSTFCAIASQLINDDNTKILWVCPRDNLVKQAEQGFRGDGIVDVGDKDIRIASNSGDVFRGCQGVVTTYQAIIASQQRWIDVSKKYKLILFLDEFDSLSLNSEWSKPMQIIYDNSFLRIPATGTIDRSDNLPLSYLDYLPDGSIDFSESNTRKWVIYDNEQALRDKSILPFKTKLISGSGKYIDKDGLERRFEKFTGKSDELTTAFSTGFAYQIFNESINDWLEFRKLNPWAKMIVIATNIIIAKEYTKWIKEKGFRFDIATSEDNVGSKDTIKRFKLDNKNPYSLDGLVSVSQAYKGLDCPPATFMIFLTRIRGKAWCQQAIGRIQRNYKGGNKTCGFVYAPDDPKMREVIDKINASVLDCIMLEIEEQRKVEKENEEKKEMRTITALESQAHIQGNLEPLEKTERIETISEKEIRLRKSINKISNRVFAKAGAGNRRVKERIFWLKVKQIVNNGKDSDGKTMRKPLKDMSIKELEKVLKYIESIYN